MRVDWLDILFPPVAAMFLLVAGWGSARSINGGRALTALQRGMVVYASLFVFGLSYIMALASWLRWPGWAWAVPIAAWGAFLAYIAWRRYRRHHATTGKTSSVAQRRSNLRQGLAVVAVLVTLIVATIEWDFVWEHQGHWLAAALWSAGVAGSILLAYGNRRTTVITTLRAYLVLMVIGVIAERQTAALIFLAIAVAVYFILDKLWKKPHPPVLDLDALGGDPSPSTEDSHVETKRR